MPLRRLAFVPLLVLVSCGPTFAPTGARENPREENCDFEVLAREYTTGYREIGVIDLQMGPTPVDMAIFKRTIRAKVCAAGGDAAQAVVNGSGQYIKAIVLKQSLDLPVARTPPKENKAPTPAAPGCQFDNQCKGDRICVKGECTDPAPRPSSSVQ